MSTILPSLPLSRTPENLPPPEAAIERHIELTNAVDTINRIVSEDVLVAAVDYVPDVTTVIDETLAPQPAASEDLLAAETLDMTALRQNVTAAHIHAEKN